MTRAPSGRPTSRPRSSPIAVAIFLVAPILVIFPLSFTSETLMVFPLARLVHALVRRLLHQSRVAVGAAQQRHACGRHYACRHDARYARRARPGAAAGAPARHRLDAAAQPDDRSGHHRRRRHVLLFRPLRPRRHILWPGAGAYRAGAAARRHRGRRRRSKASIPIWLRAAYASGASAFCVRSGR